MADSTIYARVQPQTIKVTEKYNFEINISSNPETKPLDVPTGEIEVIIPYNGDNHFTELAIADIKQQRPNIWKKESNWAARIGYLAFSHHNDIKPTERTNLNLSERALPIDVPICGQGLVSEHDLVDTRYQCVVSESYTPPDLPIINPIDVQINIFDEESIVTNDEFITVYEQDNNIPTKELFEVLKEFFKKDSNFLVNNPDLTKEDIAEELANIIPKQDILQDNLYLDLIVELSLPQHIKIDSPMLTRMAIEWPVTILDRSMILKIGTTSTLDKSVIYIPEQGVIEWQNVELQQSTENSSGSNLVKYNTKNMRLLIEHPGELYNKEELKGKVEIKIPQVLAWAGIDYFEANGQEGQIDIKQETIMTAELKLNLAYCFSRKMYYPYQHLQFEGVILDDMRIIDITTILKNMGFETKRIPVGTEDP